MDIILSGITWVIMYVKRHYREMIIYAGLLLVLLAVMMTFDYCKGREDRINNGIQSNIDQLKGVNGVIEIQRNTALKEIENAANDTNRAVNELNNSINTDSNKSNGSRANRRFCERYPDDSTCQ